MSGHQQQGQQSTAPMNAEDILARMRQGVKTTGLIRLRGFEVPVRVLSITESNSLRKEGIRTATTENGDEIDKNIAIQKATLRLASTLNPGSAPILLDKALDAMTIDELNHLYNEYVKFMDDVNPSFEMMPSDQVNALTEALKKNSVSARDLSLRDLRVVCSMFAELIQTMENQDSLKAK